MQSVKVSDKQTLFDIAILGTGSFESLIELAALNGLSVTEDIKSGDDISIEAVADVVVVTGLQERKAKPSSAGELTEQPILPVTVKQERFVTPVFLVSDRETLFDIAVMQSGDITAAFDLALMNGISITEGVVSGQQLTLTEMIDIDVVSDLVRRHAKPASNDPKPPPLKVPGGIGYMQIENDFIVS